jgi:hypothetical protein
LKTNGVIKNVHRIVLGEEGGDSASYPLKLSSFPMFCVRRAIRIGSSLEQAATACSFEYSDLSQCHDDLFDFI